MEIIIITTKGRGDKNPTVNWKDIDIGELILFHEDECHFNLIVSKQSDLAVNGSLSFRFHEENDDIIGWETEEDVENQEIDTKIKELEK